MLSLFRTREPVDMTDTTKVIESSTLHHLYLFNGYESADSVYFNLHPDECWVGVESERWYTIVAQSVSRVISITHRLLRKSNG